MGIGKIFLPVREICTWRPFLSPFGCLALWCEDVTAVVAAAITAPRGNQPEVENPDHNDGKNLSLDDARAAGPVLKQCAFRLLTWSDYVLLLFKAPLVGRSVHCSHAYADAL